MKPLISLPREALAELLRASGSTLTPEEYVASLPGMVVHKKYPARAIASAWSKYVLLIVAAFGVVILPFNFNIEDLIVVSGLAAVTFFEFRVNRYFREGDARAPSLGFRNQAAFAAAILIYGLYHALVPSQLPSQYREIMDPDMTGLIRGLERIFYLIIGIIGGISQFALAWYYRTAEGSKSAAKG